MLNKIILGTAQFGLDYGIANTNGKISKEGVAEILDYAYIKGINTLDTAYSYGDSEEVIGDYIANSHNSYNIISKVPALEQNLPKSIRHCCQESIRRLSQKSLYGCLFHCTNNIEQSAMVLEVLTVLKKEGLIKHIGVSLYNPNELDYLLSNNLQFDIIQVPYNIFDQRFKNYFLRLKKKNIKIHIRSIFLQGLFFLTRETIAEKFTVAVKNMNKLHDLSRNNNMTILELCICFVFMNSSIDKIVMGIDFIKQLKNNIDALKCLDKAEQVYSFLKTLRIDDESVILPYKWK